MNDVQISTVRAVAQVHDIQFEGDVERKCSIEIRRELGITDAIERQRKAVRKAKPCKPRQSAAEREAVKVEFEGTLAVLNRIEESSGPTLRADLAKAKRFQAAFTIGEERKQLIRRRLGQRNGLLRLMQCETHQDYPAETTKRAGLYVEQMLRLSAAVAALSESGWPSTLKWLETRLPAIVIGMGADRLKAEFDVYRAEAINDLASMSPRVGPSPASIADALQITTEQLRYAEANRCGLTSIDRSDPKTQDRIRKERHRREAGMRPQSERTKTVDLQALADRCGCSLSTIKRHQRAGTLEKFLVERSDPNLSGLNLFGTPDTFGSSPIPANDDTPQSGVMTAA